MNTSKLLAITVAMLGTFLGFGGLIRAVYARSPQSAVAVMPQHRSSHLVAEASDGDGEANDNVEEQQEQAKLQPLAKITPSQAQQAAETSVGSKASSVKLENEDGNLVYTVIVGQNEVKVDAGNGRLLYAENDRQNNEKQEASRFKSSIQVPQTEHGEMNDEAK